jgi:hypothetical protein
MLAVGDEVFMWLTGGAVVLGMLMFCLGFPVLILKLKIASTR